MIKILFVINLLLTLPFGLIALIIPATIFAGFGVNLDAGGQLIARGYSATLIGYGLLFYFLRNSEDVSVRKSLLFSAFTFNLIEAVIQGLAGFSAITSSMIWGNVVAHSVVAILCFYSYFSIQDK